MTVCKSMHLVCKKCMHEWEYTGDKHRTSCSRCKTSITVYRDVYLGKVTKVEPVSLKFPVSLWKDARFQQRMMGLKANGETYLEVKCDMDGMISLR